jgi:hypothetical protein
MVFVSFVSSDCFGSPFYITSKVFKPLNNMSDFVFNVKPVVLNPTTEGIEEVFVPGGKACHLKNYNVFLPIFDVF